MNKKWYLFLCILFIFILSACTKETNTDISTDVSSSILMTLKSIKQYDNLLEANLEFRFDNNDTFDEIYIPKNAVFLSNGKQIDSLSMNFYSELSDDNKILNVSMVCSLPDGLSFDEAEVKISNLISSSTYKRYSIQEYFKEWRDTANIDKHTNNPNFFLSSEKQDVEFYSKRIETGAIQFSKNVIMINCKKVLEEKNKIEEYTDNILDGSGAKTGVYVTVIYNNDEKEILDCSLDKNNNIIALSPKELNIEEIKYIDLDSIRYSKNEI